MKKVIRFVGFAAVLAALFAVGSTVSYAQAECDNVTLNGELDGKIRENYAKDETLKVAVEAAKQYLEKFGTCDAYKDFSDWVRPQLPKWEERVKMYDEWVWRKSRIERFDASIKTEKYEDAFAAGGEIINRYEAMDQNSPVYYNTINQIVALGLAGLRESYKQNYKFNNDSLKYAKMAIAKLRAGAKSAKKNDKGQEIFGAFHFDRTREDAISELTYATAFINYWDKKDKKTALASYYEVTQMPGYFKNEPRVYATIGEYYKDEAVKIGAEIAKLVNDLKAAATDEEKLKIDGEIKPKEALFNGYAERAMDAFGRAHKIAPSVTPEDKKYKEGLYGVLKGLYELRFPGKSELDSWVATTVAKPMPNPTSEVQPVVDPTPETTTTTTTTGSTAVNRP